MFLGGIEKTSDMKWVNTKNTYKTPRSLYSKIQKLLHVFDI